MKRALALAALVACGGDSDDIVGPFSGPVHRFVVDRITVPRDTAEAQVYASDLDGDGELDNQLGAVTAVLSSIGDLSEHGADMLAAGAIASTVELQADDLVDDPTVGVTYVGADGDVSTVAGGRLVGGAFVSNRTATTSHPGRAVVRLPIYANADPLAIELDGVELELAPDGAGGYDASVRGAVRHARARAVADAGLRQMFATEPERHLVFLRGVDTDHDGVMSAAELDASIVGLLVVADVQLFVGDRHDPVPGSTQPDSISLAFGVHLAPCGEGRCATPAAPTCRDRVRNGDETDIDCGGACQPCADGLACGVPTDCQSAACDGGACRAATCSDGVRDGVESDVDCGGPCGVCALGAACAGDGDCASGNCTNGMVTLGVCEP